MTRFSEQDIAALNQLWQPQNRGLVTPENPQNRDILWFAARHAGIVITPEIALQVSTVWACIEIIAKSIAAQPWNIYEQLAKGDRDLLFNDQVGYLLNCRPNSEMSAVSMREALGMAAVSWGNCYAEIEWDRSNRPFALWPIAPDRVDPVRTNGRLQYRIQNELNPPVYLDPENILHIHGMGITGLMGANIISQAAHSIALAIASERFAESYFQNNTQIGGALKYPNKLDDPSFDRLKEEWARSHQGPNRAFSPAILDQGAEWVPMGADGETSQMNESRAAQVADICRWFGVPPHKVADLSRSTNNNIEHQGLEFVRDALQPWAVRFQQEVDYKLLDTRGKPRFSEIDLDRLSQGDAVSRQTYYVGMRNIGVYSANDILKMERKNTIGAEGDIRIVNGANIKLQDVGAAFPKPGAAVAPAKPDGGTPPADVSQVSNTFRAMFGGFFDRVEARRQARLADLAEKMDVEGIASQMRFFASQQIASLSDNLRKPCEALSEIVGADTFAMALAAGHRVAAGEQSPADAVEDLMKSAFGDRV